MAKAKTRKKRTPPETPRKDLFVKEYLVDLNATQAAIRAGYSPKTAKSQGGRLLTDVDVKAAIQEAMDKRSARVEVTADQVLGEILRIASVDISKAYNAHGALLPIHEMPEDIRRAIAGIEVHDIFEGAGTDRKKVGEVQKVKFWDKPRALELLGKHLKLFTEVREIRGLDKLADAMRAAEARLANRS